VPDGEPVLVGDAPPQDEGIVVESEIRRVHEEDFANLQRGIDEIFAGEIDVGLGCRPTHDLGKIEEALAGGEVVRSQDELALEVLDLVGWKGVGVPARLHVGDPRNPALLLGRLLDLLLRSSLWHRSPQYRSHRSATMRAAPSRYELRRFDRLRS